MHRHLEEAFFEVEPEPGHQRPPRGGGVRDEVLVALHPDPAPAEAVACAEGGVGHPAPEQALDDDVVGGAGALLLERQRRAVAAVLLEVEAALVLPVAVGGGDGAGVAEHGDHPRLGVARQDVGDAVDVARGLLAPARLALRARRQAGRRPRTGVGAGAAARRLGPQVLGGEPALARGCRRGRRAGARAPGSSPRTAGPRPARAAPRRHGRASPAGRRNSGSRR